MMGEPGRIRVLTHSHMCWIRLWYLFLVFCHRKIVCLLLLFTFWVAAVASLFCNVRSTCQHLTGLWNILTDLFLGWWIINPYPRNYFCLSLGLLFKLLGLPNVILWVFVTFQDLVSITMLCITPRPNLCYLLWSLGLSPIPSPQLYDEGISWQYPSANHAGMPSTSAMDLVRDWSAGEARLVGRWSVRLGWCWWHVIL